jgi:nucleoside-diphosphate-sugar epimerase
MNILLTGATGFLGYRTLEKLVEDSMVSRVLATGRNLPEYRRIIHPKVQYVFGKLEDASFANEITQDQDVIINTASLSSPWGKEKDFIIANVRTQENLLNAAKASGVRRFIYISSPGIYFNGRHRLNVKESDPLPARFANAYASTKFAAETLLPGTGIPYIILRPRALIGRGDSIIMPRLIQAFDQGKLRIIGDGSNLVDLTSVANVGDAVLLSVHAKDAALNQAYNITNGEPVNLWAEISAVLHALNRELGSKKVPWLLADTFARMMELRSRLGNQKEPALTRYSVGTLAFSFTLDISKAKRLLGYAPQLNTLQAIDEFISWYRQHEKM